jgi:LCP family protein required for cell wall assembly
MSVEPRNTPRTSVLGGTYAAAEQRSARVQFRRAITLMVMTLVVPGSAQLVAGNKRIGRIAMRVWMGFIGVGLLLALIALVSRQTLISWTLGSSVPLTLGRWVLIVGMIAWIALLIDAWRLGRPLSMNRKHRLWMTGLNTAVCVLTAVVMVFAAHMVSTANSSIGTVFTATTSSGPTDGRYNVLLLGGDSGPDRDGVRPDSLTLASIDADTGRTVLVGLPRNLEDVPFPEGSVMHKAFPDGFNCDGCYLNAVNTWANDHADQFDSKDPGIEATMQAVEAITGLKVNYYAMVNMKGFSKLIDAVGGVEVDVQERTAIGGIGSPIRGYIEAGEQKLTGDQALWYSRSRVENSDFSRMGRQKCLMNAMVNQLSPKKVLLNVNRIANSSKDMLTTSIPRQDLDVFADLALKAKGQKIASVSLVPPAIYTGNPDYPKVRRMISSAIEKSEGTTAKQPALMTAKLSVPKDKTAKNPLEANQSSDLGQDC